MNERQTVSARREDWVVAANLEQLPPGSVVGIELNGRDLALCNVDGKVHCMDNVCSHAYALLSDGWLDGTVLECPLHGGQFDVVTGKALCAPVTQDLVVYQTRTIDNQIEVLISEQAPPAD
jgi:nitrite reductase/ring-hydroxylating ferredoxin subunit